MTTAPGNHGGFSLAELAIVLAVTALLFGLGASAYKTYIVRGQVTQSLALAARAQSEVAESFRRDGEPPADAAGLPSNGMEDRGAYLDSIEVVDGRIDLRFGSGADPALTGRTLSLTPFESANRDVSWVCGNHVAGPGLHPLGFANGAHQAVQVVTQIGPRYLPSNCR
jgi:type II secretory pathway pseudopilin PulG